MGIKLISEYEKYIREYAGERKLLAAKIKEIDKQIEKYRGFNRDMKGRETE